MKILTKGEYYGKQHAEVNWDGILLSEYKYTGARTDWHYHENPYFMYVLQGNMMDCNKKEKTLCPPGSLIFNNWDEPHYSSKHSLVAGGFHLEFERKWLEKHGFSLNVREGNQLIQDPQTHLLLAQLYHEFLLSDTFSKVSVESLVLQICTNLSEINDCQTQKPPSWIDGLKELLHFDVSDLSLAYLSNQLGVHPVHISRVASKYLSMNLGEYIRQSKLKRAFPLLFDPSLSLTEIAYEVGFSDQSHFNRVFKAHFQINPSAYRKMIQKT